MFVQNWSEKKGQIARPFTQIKLCFDSSFNSFVTCSPESFPNF